jgi:hypothetical protein
MEAGPGVWTREIIVLLSVTAPRKELDPWTTSVEKNDYSFLRVFFKKRNLQRSLRIGVILLRKGNPSAISAVVYSCNQLLNYNLIVLIYKMIKIAKTT